jgi:hypothetical protein
MRGYSHLSDDEREQIGLLKVLGHSIGAIARAIRRPKSTISRELSRNRLPSGRYSPLHAAGAYQLRRRRDALIEKDQALRSFVLDRLAEGWTPEQIAGWLKAGNECRLRAVGCETIYAFIYRAAQKAEQLWRYLTRRHKRRRPRRSRPSRDTIKDRISIHERPENIDARTEAGWIPTRSATQRVLRLTRERPDFPSSFAAFRWISGMRRRLRGKENREGSKRSGVALRVGIQAGHWEGDLIRASDRTPRLRMLPRVIGGPGGEGMTASPRAQDALFWKSPRLALERGSRTSFNSETLWLANRSTFPARAGTSAANYAQFLSATDYGSSEISLINSDSGQALAVWVRTFPRELSANANFATFPPSGASTIKSRSCSPVVRNTCWMSTFSFFARSRAVLLRVGVSLTARIP